MKKNFNTILQNQTIHAVIFDMDGTLLDTLKDIALCVNKVLKNHRYPVHPVLQYRSFVGSGFMNLLTQALPANHRHNKNLIDDLVVEFANIYHREWHRHTVPYSGIGELLDYLEENHYSKSIVTNKRQAFADVMVKETLGSWKFDMIIGENPGGFRKPDPSGVRKILDEWKLPPEQVLFIGDSAVDMETARRSSTVPVGVAWGFTTPEALNAAGAEIVLNNPLDLKEYLR